MLIKHIHTSTAEKHRGEKLQEPINLYGVKKTRLGVVTESSQAEQHTEGEEEKSNDDLVCVCVCICMC